jgi:hypothetical protein
MIELVYHHRRQFPPPMEHDPAEKPVMTAPAAPSPEAKSPEAESAEQAREVLAEAAAEGAR